MDYLQDRVSEHTKKMKENEIDVTVLFQHSNIRYFTNFRVNEVTETILVIKQNGEIYYLVPILDYKRAVRDCWINNIISFPEDTDDYLYPLKEIIDSTGTNLGVEFQSIRAGAKIYLDQIHKGIKKDVGPLLLDQRKIKTEFEISQIRKAAKIAEMTMNECLNLLKKKSPIRECDISAYAKYVMETNGAETYSFEPFVMSGKDAALPRRFSTEKELENGELILFDMGAIYEGYCSDITRTFTLGCLTKEQRNIFNVAYEAQQKAIREIRPGRTAEEIDAIARNYIEEQGYKDAFPHLTGHGLGIDIHEYPIIEPEQTTVLEKGMIVTIEPGIYVQDIGAARIEDMVLITDSGYECLTNVQRNLI